MGEARSKIIIKGLEGSYPRSWFFERKDPFETLIATILSQNTSDVNSRRAYENLSRKYLIKPMALALLRHEDIEPLIHVAGLSNIKSRRIVEVAQEVMERFNGDLAKLSRMPLREAREGLLSLRGVGYKTADVVLLFSLNHKVLPLDTHIMRVARRLRLADEKAGYEEIRVRLEEEFKNEDYRKVHILLIIHGRNICKSIKPECDKCSISKVCPSRRVKVLNKKGSFVKML